MARRLDADATPGVDHPAWSDHDPDVQLVPGAGVQEREHVAAARRVLDLTPEGAIPSRGGREAAFNVLQVHVVE